MDHLLAVLGAVVCAFSLLTLYFCWQHETTATATATAPRSRPAASLAADPAGAACPAS